MAVVEVGHTFREGVKRPERGSCYTLSSSRGKKAFG